MAQFDEETQKQIEAQLEIERFKHKKRVQLVGIQFLAGIGLVSMVFLIAPLFVPSYEEMGDGLSRAFVSATEATLEKVKDAWNEPIEIEDMQNSTTEVNTDVGEFETELIPESKKSFEQRVGQFRGVDWGMSRAEVRKNEKSDPDADEDLGLLYTTSVNGLDANLLYMLIEDKLIKANYNITESHSNKYLYITDYNKLKELLTTKYGEPTEDKVFWFDDLYKDDPSDWGLAVSIGHLTQIATFETEEADIGVILKGDNYSVDLVIEYISKEYEYLLDEYIEQNQQGAL